MCLLHTTQCLERRGLSIRQVAHGPRPRRGWLPGSLCHAGESSPGLGRKPGSVIAVLPCDNPPLEKGLTIIVLRSTTEFQTRHRHSKQQGSSNRSVHRMACKSRPGEDVATLRSGFTYNGDSNK